MIKIVRIKTITASALCACAIGLLSIVNLAQQSTEEAIKAIKSKLFDAPKVIYKLEAMNTGKSFSFCNTSKKRVTGFRLGCVKSKKSELRILSERDFQTADLMPEAENNLQCHFWSSNHGFFPTEECEKGKLAVIEVALEDGTTWKLKQ